MLVTLCEIGEEHTSGFHVKAKNERFTAAGSRCRQNPNIENFTSFARLRQKNCTKKRAARVARLFYPHLTN